MTKARKTKKPQRGKNKKAGGAPSLPWLAVIGIGEDGVKGLSPRARAWLQRAGSVVGGRRHLALVADGKAEKILWQNPLSRTLSTLRARRGAVVAVLASGDPMHYGIGATLARHFDPAEMEVLPAASAFSLAAARLGWAMQECALVSLHGRPFETIQPHLQPGARLLVLSEDGTTPKRLARHMAKSGFGQSVIHVFEHMGGAREKYYQARAARWGGRKSAALNTLAVECLADAKMPFAPRVPGLSESLFAHDGQITKRHVRAATLAALGPSPRALLWDVGAGSGAVSIEWLRAEPLARAIAIEPDKKRRMRIGKNALALGVPHLEIVCGRAPQVLGKLEAPDAVFIGGGLGGKKRDPRILDHAYRALKPGGRLVANAVTQEAERALVAFAARFGGSLTRLEVSSAKITKGATRWKARAPIVQLALIKQEKRRRK